MNKNQKTVRKKGFTIVEVMLVLAIAGLLLVGTLGSLYPTIKAQRYNDAVTAFAEDLKQIYNEVLNPRSVNDESGRDKDQAIYGKLVVFNSRYNNSIYTVTLTGEAETSNLKDDPGFVTALVRQKVTIACDTLERKTLPWEARIVQPDKKPLQGMNKAIFIARSPFSGAVHTMTTNFLIDFEQYGEGIKKNCEKMQDNFHTKFFIEGGIANGYSYSLDEDVVFCIKSDDSDIMRGVQLSADGANSSAVRILTDEDSQKAGCGQ